MALVTRGIKVSLAIDDLFFVWSPNPKFQSPSPNKSQLDSSEFQGITLKTASQIQN